MCLYRPPTTQWLIVVPCFPAGAVVEIRQYSFSVVNLFQNNRAKQIAHVLGHGRSETVAIVCVQHQPTDHKQCTVLHELMLKTLMMKAIAFQFMDHCLPRSSDRHVSVGIITGARGDVLNLMIAFLSQTVGWTDISQTFAVFYVLHVLYCTCAKKCFRVALSKRCTVCQCVCEASFLLCVWQAQ